MYLANCHWFWPVFSLLQWYFPLYAIHHDNYILILHKFLRGTFQRWVMRAILTGYGIAGYRRRSRCSWLYYDPGSRSRITVLTHIDLSHHQCSTCSRSAVPAGAAAAKFDHLILLLSLAFFSILQNWPSLFITWKIPLLISVLIRRISKLDSIWNLHL